MSKFSNAFAWLVMIVAAVALLSGLWWVIDLVIPVDYRSFMIGAAVSWFSVFVLTVYATMRRSGTPQEAQEGGSERLGELGRYGLPPDAYRSGHADNFDA